MAGRIKKFFKRNMSFPKGFGRKKSRFKLASPQFVTDGSTTQPFDGLTVGQTKSIPLLLVGDLGLGNGWDARNRPAALLSNLKVTMQFACASAGTDEAAAMTIIAWFIQCNALVQTDWVTNSRDPGDGSDSLGAIASANPYKVLAKPGMTRLMFDGVDREEHGGKIKLGGRGGKTWVHYPDQIYLMYQLKTLTNLGSANIDAGDIELRYELSFNVRRPITT